MLFYILQLNRFPPFFYFLGDFQLRDRFRLFLFFLSLDCVYGWLWLFWNFHLFKDIFSKLSYSSHPLFLCLVIFGLQNKFTLLSEELEDS